MFFYSNAFRITAFIFIIVTVLLTLIKPAIFFDGDGQLKAFGLTYNDQTTPIPFGVFIYGFLILLYMIVIFLDSRLICVVGSIPTTQSIPIPISTSPA